MRRTSLLLLALLPGLALLAGCPQPRRIPDSALGEPPPLPDRSCREDRLSFDVKQDGGYGAYAERRARCYKKWTLLIYMAADNDLLPWAYFNLAEMEAGSPAGPVTASGPEADVVVQLDGRGPGDVRRLHVFPAGRPLPADLREADLAQWGGDRLASPVVERPEEPAAGDPAADLRAFITWGMRRYPAQHYLVAVWGHGRGWGLAQRDLPPPAGGGDPFVGQQFAGGIAFDWTQRTYLGIPPLRDALRQAEQEVLGGRPVDIYLSDACLMQSAEVATELGGVAQYIVGSTQIEDFAGTPYGDLLALLNGQPPVPPACQGRPDQEACTVAQLLPELYERSFQGGPRARLRPGAREHLTMSTVRASELPASLLPAMARLGGDLSRYIAEDPLVNGGDVLCVLQELDRCRVEGTNFLGNARDIGVFLRAMDRARQETPAGQALHRSIAAASEALGRTVVAHRAGTQYPREGFYALSVWLPVSQADYQRHRDRFAASSFSQHGKQPGAPLSPWQAWLDRAYP